MEQARVVADRYSTDHHELIVRPDAVELLPKLAEALGSRARLLDVHSDPDHNRSVFTFVAPPNAAVEAALARLEADLALSAVLREFSSISMATTSSTPWARA